MPRPATLDEISGIADRAVSIFASYQYNCCLFGSAACALYGTSRCPNDVDLVVLTNDDPEQLKGILVDEDEDFYLVPSRRRNADYEVLWYQLPSGRNEEIRACKVDILIPGILNIPYVPSRHIEFWNSVPLMPLLPLLLLKLQGWTDHRNSNRWDERRKQYVDVEDIDELLSIACDESLRIGDKDWNWIGDDFFDEAQDHVIEYVEQFPVSILYWQTLGFEAY